MVQQTPRVTCTRSDAAGFPTRVETPFVRAKVLRKSDGQSVVSITGLGGRFTDEGVDAFFNLLDKHSQREEVAARGSAVVCDLRTFPGTPPLRTMRYLAKWATAKERHARLNRMAKETTILLPGGAVSRALRAIITAFLVVCKPPGKVLFTNDGRAFDRMMATYLEVPVEEAPPAPAQLADCAKETIWSLDSPTVECASKETVWSLDDEFVECDSKDMVWSVGECGAVGLSEASGGTATTNLDLSKQARTWDKLAKGSGMVAMSCEVVDATPRGQEPAQASDGGADAAEAHSRCAASGGAAPSAPRGRDTTCCFAGLWGCPQAPAQRRLEAREGVRRA